MSAAMQNDKDLTKISLRSRTMALQATDRLKELYPQAVSVADLLSYLMNVAEQSDGRLVDFFFKTFKRNGTVNWNEKENTYRYKPPYDVSSPEELLKYFQEQEIAKGIPITELQLGWKDCIPAIDQLDREHKLIVLRNKKDQSPRMIWANDPTLYAPLDDEYVKKWFSVSLPGEDEIRTKLQAMSSKAAGEAPRVFQEGGKAKAKKKVRRGHKITNTHMQFLEGRR